MGEMRKQDSVDTEPRTCAAYEWSHDGDAMEVRVTELAPNHPGRAHGLAYDAALLANGLSCGNGRFCATLEEADRYARNACAQSVGHEPRLVRGVLVPVDERPVDVWIEPGDNGSCLGPLQTLVDGYVDAMGVPFGPDVTVYVNDDGLSECAPNRTIFATREMARAGYPSQLDYRTVASAGDVYTMLCGNIVVLGFDRKTGQDVSLTKAQAGIVADYFTRISGPGSGMSCAREIMAGRVPRGVDPSVMEPVADMGLSGKAPNGPGYTTRVGDHLHEVDDTGEGTGAGAERQQSRER